MIRKIIAKIRILLLRNSILLCYPTLPAKKNSINLNYYRSGFKPGVRKTKDSGRRNLGDDLAPHILAYALGQKSLTPESPTKKRTHLYSVGSILFFGYQNAVVWGSGILFSASALRTFFHRALF